MEYEHIGSSAKHMQSKIPVVKKRSPVQLKIYATDSQKLLFEKQFEPRGLRQDIAMFIYSQLVLNENSVDVELYETAFKDKKYRLNNIQLKKGDGTFVIFKDNKLLETGVGK